MTAPKISFVIVAYNSGDTIQACLESIVQKTSPSFEVVVVDNSPNQETQNAVNAYLGTYRGDNIRLTVPGENLGFAKGCNRGALMSSGEYLFFLNPDTELLNDAAAHLLECFRHNPRAAIIGPAIFSSDGAVTKTCRNLPTVARMVMDATGIDHWTGSYRLLRFDHQSARRVEQIMGAAMLLPTDLYRKLHGMDEQFFIYYEEVDLCKRIAEAGGEVWFWPSARVRHLAGVSTEATSVRARMIYVLRESRIKYFRKHFGTTGAWSIGIVNRAEGFMKWIVLHSLGVLRKSGNDREKAKGFLSVALGKAPRK